jgi:hypothetical protein
LRRIDIIRIKDLCTNYNKLQKYYELILGLDNKFRVEIPKDLGRELADYQLQHATNSIRKSRLYIEKCS